MARATDSIRLGYWHQFSVYAVTAALGVSGAVWLLCHYFLAVPGDFGPRPHPLEHWLLRLHGAAAMAGLIVYGSLLPIHVRRAWSLRRNIALGVTLICSMLLLTVTGYLLYYAGGEDSRAAISLVHWVAGLLVPALLAWHVLSGRSQTKAAMTAAPAPRA
jgi:hypothetical protein